MKRVTLIIIKENKILLLHRFKNGREFFAFPGGGVEQGESIEEAAIREAKEETGFDMVIEEYIMEFINDFDKRINHVFKMKIIAGELELGGPELERNSPNNRYILEWHDMKNLEKIYTIPNEVKTYVLNKSN